jgi:hypothetical protein
MIENETKFVEEKLTYSLSKTAKKKQLILSSNCTRGHRVRICFLLQISGDNSFESSVSYNIIYFAIRPLFTRHSRQNLFLNLFLSKSHYG